MVTLGTSLVIAACCITPWRSTTALAFTVSSVPGENYEICNEPEYLTSPWTYDALASGSASYTVAQYEDLAGYGTTLPPLPSYISSEASSTQAALIYAPGSDVDVPAYDFPETPIIYFFEGGSYGPIGLMSISGDEFIGGSTASFPEPEFDDAAQADGINAQNATYDFSGGSSTLAATADTGAMSITTTTPIPGYIYYVSFADGTLDPIASVSGDTIQLDNGLPNQEAAGAPVWANVVPPIATVADAATAGTTSVLLTASSIPLVTDGNISIGGDTDEMTSVSGSQSDYTVGVAGLDMPVIAGTPVYYDGLAGDVTVSYLDIDNDQHVTTGTIYTGAGWTITNNDIHDGNSGGPGYGVAIYGGQQGTITQNCLSNMGDYGVNLFGDNTIFDENEIYGTNYQEDPGCGCSGGGKWWGTLNADIEDNAFIDDGPGGGGPIWLDNGNAGTLITGNYFYMDYGAAIASETGYNLEVTDNLFLDDGWGNGTGDCSGGTNCGGTVNINTSGGFEIPGSRYPDEILISGNQFIDDWMGVDIWQSGGRSCENSGEGWPDDADYCSGGFPTTATPAADGDYYFSHIGDPAHNGGTSLAEAADAGSSTILVQGAEAIDDQVGFASPASTTTSDTTDVTSFTGTQSIDASTTGFPSSGMLRVGTSEAWSDAGGSFTGAILSYTSTSASTFNDVSFVRGSGTLAGPILQVQPYTVTAETCYANDCALTISPALSASESAGTEVTNAGTCQLFATSAALPSEPIAPDGISYWDGCQWEVRDVSVSGNTFVFQPSLIASSAPLSGGGMTTSCTNSYTDGCGTNFMAYQVAGEAPFDSPIGAVAMMSDSTFSGCPSWDSGCTDDPLDNLNSDATTSGVPADNGEAPGNNSWSDNTYVGPWGFNVYLFGACYVQPSDPNTGQSIPSSACQPSFAQWQSVWQQDTSSTFDPVAVSLDGVTTDQEVHGNDVALTSYIDGPSGDTVTGSLDLNSTLLSTVTDSPATYGLNTLSYPDGTYTVQLSAVDGEGDTGSDAITVYIANGDLNGDGKVNISDLAIMAAHWGQADSSYADGNITGESTINISDLAVLAANWGWTEP